jgi:hypothetical protein
VPRFNFYPTKGAALPCVELWEGTYDEASDFAQYYANTSRSVVRWYEHGDEKWGAMLAYPERKEASDG